MSCATLLDDGRLHLGGIKLSLELVQLNCLDLPGESRRTGGLLRLLAERRINLAFFFYSPGLPGSISSFGLEAEEFDQVESTLMGDPDLAPGLEMIRPAGTLTLFPHRSDLALLGRVLGAWGRSGFPLYGMGTSISTVTISTDYRLLDRAVEALKALLGLPPDTRAQRPEFRVKQVR